VSPIPLLVGILVELIYCGGKGLVPESLVRMVGMWGYNNL